MNFNIDKAIIVWRFAQAPEELKALSNNGGDEDWLALIQPGFNGVWVGWLESQAFDSCAEPQMIETQWGRVYIGSHA